MLGRFKGKKRVFLELVAKPPVTTPNATVKRKGFEKGER